MMKNEGFVFLCGVKPDIRAILKDSVYIQEANNYNQVSGPILHIFQIKLSNISKNLTSPAIFPGIFLFHKIFLGIIFYPF